MVVKNRNRKIAFIESNPFNLRGNYTKCNNFEPYGLELLAGIAQKEGYSVGIFQQNEIPDEEFVNQILNENPDILAFSSMAFNYDSSVELARIAKRKNSNAKVIFGGPHVSSYPKGLEEALKGSIVDFGVKGEAGYSFRDLVNNTEEPDLSLSGLIYLDSEDNLVINSQNERIKNLDNLPFAKRGSKILERTKVGRVMYPAQSEQISTATIAYSRGCSFSCSYCDSRNIWGNKVVWRSASNVVDEIEELKERHGTNTIFFSDLTFNSNPDKIMELCDEIQKKDVDVKWYVLARVASPNGKRVLMDKNLLENMYDAGCRKIGYGLESVIPEVQSNFRKIIPNGAIEELVEEGHKLGILSKGFVILGDPEYESIETVNKTLEELKRIKFDEIRISFLTPFPGSELFYNARDSGLLLTEDFSRYTTDEPVLRCKNLTSEELIKAREHLTGDYYRSDEYSNMVRRMKGEFPELERSYEEHHGFLAEKGVI